MESTNNEQLLTLANIQEILNKHEGKIPRQFPPVDRIIRDRSSTPTESEAPGICFHCNKSVGIGDWMRVALEFSEQFSKSLFQENLHRHGGNDLYLIVLCKECAKIGGILHPQTEFYHLPACKEMDFFRWVQDYYVNQPEQARYASNMTIKNALQVTGFWDQEHSIAKANRAVEVFMQPGHGRCSPQSKTLDKEHATETLLLVQVKALQSITDTLKDILVELRKRP